jgi:DNA-directed RNA polymerase subunit RPC12/RpoP
MKENTVGGFLAKAKCRPVLRRGLLARLSCLLFGHKVDNRVFSQVPASLDRCDCGVSFLQEDGTVTRVRHTLSCFLRHHSYIRLTERNGHTEYVCLRCGHPLLFEIARDPYAHRVTFEKKVRYLCNLFGHRVHQLSQRVGFTEYACHCGHSFLQRDPERRRVTHPLICFIAGHFVQFLGCRSGYREYVCRNCGHTFCFVAQVSRPLTQAVTSRLTPRDPGVLSIPHPEAVKKLTLEGTTAAC